MDFNEKFRKAAEATMQSTPQAEKTVSQTEQKTEEQNKPPVTNEQQETQKTEETTETKQELTVNDDMILNYLRENRGMEIGSLDDISKPAPLSFASPEVEQFNIFAQETGRGLDDYLRLKKDWTQASDEEVARTYFLQQNPNLGVDDFNDFYDLDLKPIEGDDYTPEEIAARNREVKKRDVRLKQLANEGRNQLSEMQAKIKTPVERAQSQQAAVEASRKAWQDGVAQAAQNLNLGIEGYKHEVSANELTERYSSLEKVTNLFKDQAGNFDASKMMTVIEKGLAFDNIKKVLMEQAQTKAKEDVLKELERPSEHTKTESQTTKEVDQGKEHAKSIFRQHFGIKK